MKLKSNFKRILSGVMSLAMAATLVPSIPVLAEDFTTQNYVYDNYAVSYNVTNSWGDTEVVSVTLSNTGDSTIENWMLYFDPNGSTSSIWDAQWAETSTGVSYVKNAGYNARIEPNSSITFSYTVDNCEAVPEAFKLCQGRINKESGYDVQLVVNETWGDNFNGAIVITNNTDSPIEAWELTFDTNFTITEITNSWAATVTELEPYSYRLKGTYTGTVYANSSVTLGFTGVKNGDPEISNTSLTEVVANESLIDFIKNYPDGVSIYAYGDYNNEANAIDIEWYTDYEAEVFDVWQSDDNESYTLVSEVSDADSYQYVITEDFQTKYFKVSIPNDFGETIESVPFVVTKTEDEYSVDFLDSDGDGLPDIYENMIGTDLNNPDTDGDGLTDYQEVYITGTDPTKYDSVTDGVSDADADPDEDGLTNAQEIELGTDPQNDDTDGDGLKGGEEVNDYHTDPLNPDTDRDGLPDGDEPHIGLDPSDPETFEVPDADFVFEQSIPAESKALEDINTEDNAYELTVEFKSSGYAVNSAEIKQSPYSNAIKNDAVLGKSVEISYESTCKVDECVLYYKIKDNYTNNISDKYTAYTEELDGIKRLQAFRFDEDLHMLLPVETTYDLENNTVICEASELGTYCLMDIEMWLDSLGFEVEEPEIAVMALAETVTEEFIESSMIKANYNGHTYGICSVSGYDWDSAEDICEALGGHLVTINDSDEQCFIEEKLLSKGTKNSYWIGGQYTSSGWRWLTGEDFSAYTKWTPTQPDNYLGQEDKLMMYRNTNPLCTSGTFGYWNDLNNDGTCNGEAFFGLNNFGFIYEKDSYKPKTYYIVIGNNFKKLTLVSPLKRGAWTNSDTDSLTDWQEFDSRNSMLAWDSDNEPVLPTLKTVLKLKGDVKISNELTRELNGLDDYLDVVRVAPFLSDPTVEDTDGDNLLDNFDPKPKSVNNNGAVMKELSIERIYNAYMLHLEDNVSEVYDIYTATGKDSEMSWEEFIEFYSGVVDFNFSLKNASETELKITTLQRCLEYLGFLDMGGSAYGAMGGATQSAIQNFQLNYGLNISEQVEFYGKWFIEIDDITYLTIANVAANHGFYVGDKPVEAHTEYKMLCNLTAEGYGKTFFDYIPSVVPILNIEQINNDISIYSDINGKFDTVYYLDYTEPLKNIITDMTNAAESFIYYPSFNGYVQFYTNVNHGGIWDVKVRESWNNTISTIHYFSQGFKFVYNDIIMNSENLGNYLYGCTGHATGFTLNILYKRSGYAASTGNTIDNQDDLDFIKRGYDYYDEIC